MTLVVSRFAILFFFLMTSVYCMLAYVPFAYTHLIASTEVNNPESGPAWLAAFARIHPLIYIPALGLIWVTWPQNRNRRTFFSIYGLLGLVLLIRPVLSNLQLGPMSLAYAVFFLTPLIWIGVLDYRAHREEVPWFASGTHAHPRLFFSALASGLGVAVLYALIALIRQGRAPDFSIVTFSFISHAVIFAGIFVLLHLIHAIATRFETSVWIEFVAGGVMLAILIAATIRQHVLHPISVHGLAAIFYPASVGTAVAIFLAGFGTRLHAGRVKPFDSGLDMVLRPLVSARRAPFRVIVPAVLAVVLSTTTRFFDWNFMIQKLAVVVVWVLAFAAVYSLNFALAPMRRPVVFLAVALVFLAGFKAIDAENLSLDDYAGHDISFRVARELLEPTPLAAELSLYKLLATYTNIPHAVKIDPVEINLVRELVPTVAEKPHVFIFVIDSLRKDYLGAYNPRVTFTPNLDAFARENITMKNAFTRYGATGLSQPSIWAGAMLLHKQYVMPFYPMNALQRLIDVEGYDGYTAYDAILRMILKRSERLGELSENPQKGYFEFCHSTREIMAKLENSPDRPQFFYIQPQNIHISVINREKQSVPPGEKYPGFFEPYAARIKTIDHCFGEFVAFLKAKGLYDKSIIVVTSDHGDALGEGGRWGHAYTIFPEILRIPLIFRIPPAMREKVSWDPDEIAFTIDITPSIYYLLGHRPIEKHRIFGRPLFTETPEERRIRQDHWLVASSYGPVYGLLSRNGEKLYIADGVSFKEYYFDFNRDPEGTTAARLPTEMKERYDRILRQEIAVLNEFYRFNREDERRRAAR